MKMVAQTSHMQARILHSQSKMQLRKTVEQTHKLKQNKKISTYRKTEEGAKWKQVRGRKQHCCPTSGILRLEQ